MTFNSKSIIVLHHSAIAKFNPQAEIIQEYHKKKFGRWNGEYHAILEKTGEIYWHPEGLEAVLYHSGQYNEQAIGVCIAGHLGQELITFAQMNSLMEVMAKISSQYTIDHIYNHRELRPTACPMIDLRKVYEDELQRLSEPGNHHPNLIATIRSLKRAIERSEGDLKSALQRKLYRLRTRIAARTHDEIDCCPEHNHQ